MLMLTFRRDRPRASQQARTEHERQKAIAHTYKHLAELVGPAPEGGPTALKTTTKLNPDQEAVFFHLMTIICKDAIDEIRAAQNGGAR